MPPKPLTILLGLSSRKFGYTAPRPTASALSVNAITPTVSVKYRMRSSGIASIAHEAPTSAIVTIIDTAVEKRNLAMSVRRIPSGAMPIIQMRLPSSEI